MAQRRDDEGSPWRDLDGREPEDVRGPGVRVIDATHVLRIEAPYGDFEGWYDDVHRVQLRPDGLSGRWP